MITASKTLTFQGLLDSGPYQHLTSRELAVAGAVLFTLKPKEDERGYFARIFSYDEFGFDAASVSMSGTLKKSTFRGLSYQRDLARLVRCIAGSVYYIIVDTRQKSETRKRWVAVELSTQNQLSIYVPEGVASGYLTTSDDAEVLTIASAFYNPLLTRGIHYSSLNFWLPDFVKHISKKDDSYPRF